MQETLRQYQRHETASVLFTLYTGLGIDQLGITDDPFCGCTIIDKDHEATITGKGIEDYFRLLYLEVIKTQARY